MENYVIKVITYSMIIIIKKPMVIILSPIAIIIYLAISQKHIKDSNKIILFHYDNYLSYITNI